MDYVLNEEGQGLVEYALIIMFVALIVVGGVALLGNNVTNFFSNFVNANFK